MWMHETRSWRCGSAVSTVVAIAMVVLSCAGSQNQQAPEPTGDVTTDSIVVVIDNATLQRVRVFSRFDEEPSRRLGEVASNRARAYIVARSGLELQLGVIRASADRSREPRWSNPVPVSAGDSLVCRLEATGPNNVGLFLTRAGQRGGGSD